MNPVIDQYGTKKWYDDNGKLHRDDGPAIECSYGLKNKSWYINGLRHRLDGPAIEDCDGYKSWYLNGIKIHCNDNEEFLRIVKMKVLL
jgi:hypothetical protein